MWIYVIRTRRWGRGGGGKGCNLFYVKKLIIERLCYKPAAYEVMSVSKFTIEISKYIIIDRTNLNRKRNFRTSSFYFIDSIYFSRN